jgi:hypothetical protein
MKKIAITILFFSSIILSCTSQRGNSVSISTERDDNGKPGKTTVNVTDEHGSVSFVTTEDVVFSEDETGVETFKEGGSLKFKKDGNKLTAETGDDGKIYYSYNGGAATQVLNEEGNKFLVKAIKTMIAYGVGAKGRAERLFRKGGSGLVLEEMDKLKSDYTKTIYLNLLLSSSLSKEELLTVINKIGTSVNSDFEKAKLLKENAPLFLADAATSNAYLVAVKGINSDFEKANALKELLNKPLSDDQLQQVLNAAGSINSDFEKANLLKQTLQINKLSPTQFTAALKTISSINSDFEKSNVLKAALDGNGAEGEQFDEALAVINTIGSDFEKANVLKKVIGNGVKTEQQWISLINTTSSVGSDFEKGNVLVDIAKKMPDTDNVKAVYMKAAKTISSDFEFAKVVKAMK